jgi:hypothetical protein
MTTSTLAVTLWVPAMIIFGVVVLGAIAYLSISSMRQEKKDRKD